MQTPNRPGYSPAFSELQQILICVHMSASFSMQTTIMELTRERGALDVRAMRAEHELLQCQHAAQNANMDVDILKKDVASLQQRLAEKSDALRSHWTETNAKVLVVFAAFFV